MSIVPIYRLQANDGDRELPRYRFSREPTPDPNPHPGHDNEEPDTRWTCDGVAFYAWSDQRENGELREALQPVYEFHRCAGRRHQYYYSMEEEPPRGDGWKRRPYVAFWAHEDDVEKGAPAVYRFEQEGTRRDNFALATDREIQGWVREGGPAFYASERVPVSVSVRTNERKPGRVDWTFEPSTVNLAYGSILEFRRAPHSTFVFTDFKIEKGEDDFGQPEVEEKQVRVRALCGSRGKDYKYLVRVRMEGQSDEIEGDPEIVNQAPTKL